MLQLPLRHESQDVHAIAGLDEFLCEQLVEHCEASQDSNADKGDAGPEAREEL